jgi:hypothetical protein
MLVEETVIGAETGSGGSEALEAGPSGRNFALRENFAGDTELMLQRDLPGQLLKSGRIGGQEEITNPAQVNVDSEAILEFRPMWLAEHGKLDVGCRPPLGSHTAAIARRAPRPRRLPLEDNDVKASASQEIRGEQANDASPHDHDVSGSLHDRRSHYSVA